MNEQTIHIKLADPSSAETLAHIQRQTFREAYGDLHSEADMATYCASHYSVAQAEQDLADPNVRCSFAWQGTELAGYTVVKNHAPNLRIGFSAAELKQIYVLASAYGQGVARRLYQSVVADVLGSGKDGLWLCVSDLNPRALAFYRKLGFQHIGAGPTLSVGEDQLPSSILAVNLNAVNPNGRQST